jgi:DNA ligase-1
MIDTEGNEWKCQLKVDGIRGILHAEWNGTGHDITVFSRRMNDITPSLPEMSDELELPAGDFIIDGEVISENSSYSETAERIGRNGENVERDVEMQFVVFDAIIYAGEKIWNKPYRSRYSRLESLDLNTDETIQRLPLESDYEKAKERAIENEEEGLILKRMDAPYELGERSASWCKNKLDAETVDLKISGFVEGEGRLAGTLGKVELETVGGVYVGSCGSGWTDEQREQVWENRNDWLNRCIEVEARGLGSGGDSGQPKLRMPIFKRDRDADGAVDSWSRVQEVMQVV